MAKKKQNDTPETVAVAEITEQNISETLEQNYMPYAMSVIVSRALPEIDGFKPSHRKLLYTMYKMGLLNGQRTKSANIVGSTMHLNPHGDGAIYETMVRLAKGNESLLHPFIDSKGNFGKVYSRDMAYAASRYTEAKLAPICAELFGEIDRDTVDFVPNYDNTTKEPTLLPTTFPNLLVTPNLGIAVSMASNICSFNLGEVVRTTIAFIKDPNVDLFETLPAPDFSTGGEIIFDPKEMGEIYRTGRGSFRIRARWRYDKANNLIEVYEIPYTTTVENIIDKVAELVKAGKLKEISDIRDESDINGLKLTIDLKRGTDPDKLMAKLYKQTTLQDSFGANFNILIAGMPRVLGVAEILDEWVSWRVECVKRRVYFDLSKKKDRLHLLKGLKTILLDIDKAISIIRETEEEAEVVPNLMIGFGIDEAQAEYIAEIKLRNINREYILKRVEETAELEREIEDLEDLLHSRSRINQIIIAELKAVEKKYGIPRRSQIIYEDSVVEISEEDTVEDYPVNVFFTKESYFKKITPQSLRMSGEHKLKDGDEIVASFETTNRDEVLFFTNKGQAYKCRLNDFDDTKTSVLGDYLPAKLGMDDGEVAVSMCLLGDYSGSVVFAFENGKVARVPLSSYETKTNRRRLTGAVSTKSALVAAIGIHGEEDMVLISTEPRAVAFNTAAIPLKTTRDTQGVAVMTLKAKHHVENAKLFANSDIKDMARFRSRSLPVAGALLRPEDLGVEQMVLE